MSEEWTGMTASKFEEMQNERQGQGQNDPDQDQNDHDHDDNLEDGSQDTDVDSGSSTADANEGTEGEDFGNGDEETGGQEEQKSAGEVDNRGVSWKNKAMELERKMKTLEARLNKGQEQQTPPQQQSPPPPPPPPLQFNQFQQPQQGNQPNTPLDYQLEIADREALQALQGGDGRKYHELTMKVAGLQAQKIIADQDKSRRELEMKTRVCTEYPDVQNKDSLLAQWADHFFRTTYSNNPNDIERAVRDAADHLSIQPKSAKTKEQQSPSPSKLPRSRPQVPLTERGVSASNKEKQITIPRETLRAAQKMGVSAKDVQKMIKRQNYTFSSGDSVFGD